MMKKTFLAAALLLTSMMAQAQAFMKIAPTLKVGDVKTYVTENKKVQQSGTQTTNYETSFKVLKEMEEGFLIEVMQTKLDDKEASNAMERLAQLNSELLFNQPVRLVINKEGQPVGIANFPQLKQMLQTKLGFALNDLYDEKPELAKETPKDTLLQRISEAIEVDKILENYTQPGNVLCLNGKTIVIGYQEDFEIEGLKMKRTLMPSGGKTVMEMLTANLGPEEIKAMVMKEIEKADEATKKEAEAQIDQAIAAGQLYIKAGGKGTYVYGDDGWPTSISQDIDLDQAGQKMTEKEVTTLKQ